MQSPKNAPNSANNATAKTDNADNTDANVQTGADVRYDAPFLRAALAFALDFISPQNRKATIILCYVVFALTVWKYLPAAPRFADPETGKCLLGARALPNVNGAAANETDAATSALTPLPPTSNADSADSAPAPSAPSATSEPPATFRPLDGTLSAEITPLRFFWDARKQWGAFLLMGLFPALIVKFVFREKLSDYGLCWGDRKLTVRSFLLFAPLMLAIGWISGAGDGGRAFYVVYPYNPAAGVSWGAFVLHSIFYFGFYYLAWEFMFRAFLLRGLAPTTGWATAIWIQVVISTALHYGNPASETFGCIAGGLLWGFLALRTRSIFTSWGQHALLGIALDLSLVLAAR